MHRNFDTCYALIFSSIITYLAIFTSKEEYLRCLYFSFFQDNLLFHDRDKNLINIPQKQIKLQLPNINQISDLVVVKKIEDLAEVRRVYQKFAESVRIDSELNESITCM